MTFIPPSSLVSFKTTPLASQSKQPSFRSILTPYCEAHPSAVPQSFWNSPHPHLQPLRLH